MMVQLAREIFAMAAFLSAIVFGAAGIAGLYRFPDPYSRLQAGSLCGTTAVFSTFIGALALAPSGAMAARIIIITIFFLVSAPTGSHIVARFAWNAGIYPWKPSTKPVGKSSRKPALPKVGRGRRRKAEAAPSYPSMPHGNPGSRPTGGTGNQRQVPGKGGNQ